MACGDLRSRQRQLGGRASRVCGLFNRALLEGAHDLSYNHVKLSKNQNLIILLIQVFI